MQLIHGNRFQIDPSQFATYSLFITPKYSILKIYFLKIYPNMHAEQQEYSEIQAIFVV